MFSPLCHIFVLVYMYDIMRAFTTSHSAGSQQRHGRYAYVAATVVDAACSCACVIVRATLGAIRGQWGSAGRIRVVAQFSRSHRWAPQCWKGIPNEEIHGHTHAHTNPQYTYAPSHTYTHNTRTHAHTYTCVLVVRACVRACAHGLRR